MAPPIVRLTSGATVERTLSSAQIHRYEVVLRRGDYLHLTVEQQGTDAALRVSGPGGDLAVALDAADDLFEPETLALIAEDAGTYRIEIRRSASAPLRGRYVLHVDEMRPALSQDQDRVDAERAFQQGHELSTARRPAGWLDALARLDAAAVAFQALGDRRGTMRVLLETGNLQWRLGRDDAVETGRHARQIARELGDSAAESAALRILASACQRTGDSACSLKALDEAAALDHAAGHKRAEADDLNRAGITHGRTDSAEEAIAHFQRALPLARATQSTVVEANVLNNLGIAYGDPGRVRRVAPEVRTGPRQPRVRSATLNTKESCSTTWVICSASWDATRKRSSFTGERSPSPGRPAGVRTKPVHSTRSASPTTRWVSTREHSSFISRRWPSASRSPIWPVRR